MGQEVDLRDTLNRRRDQKQSQQFTAYNRHPEAALRKQREIPIKDLRRTITNMKENDVELITTATGSPFNLEIWEARLLEGFKLLAIKAYEREI